MSAQPNEADRAFSEAVTGIAKKWKELQRNPLKPSRAQNLSYDLGWVSGTIAHHAHELSIFLVEGFWRGWNGGSRD